MSDSRRKQPTCSKWKKTSSYLALSANLRGKRELKCMLSQFESTMSFKVFLMIDIQFRPELSLVLIIMENIPNVNQIIINEIRDLRKVVETAMLCKCSKVDLFDEFNIRGLEKAIEILGYQSTKTLTKRIKKGDILKINKHYRISDGGKYSFSESALLSVKGLIQSIVYI